MQTLTPHILVKVSSREQSLSDMTETRREVTDSTKIIDISCKKIVRLVLKRINLMTRGLSVI